MCWSASVSMNTFLVGLFACTLAKINGDAWPFIIFMMSFVSMQLIEYFIWTHYDNRGLNTMFTYGTLILVLLQPLAAIYLLSETQPDTAKYMASVYIAIILGWLVWLFVKGKNIGPSYKGKNGHLVWSWITKERLNWVLLCTYMFFFLLPLFLTKRYQVFALAVGTLIVSLYFFYKYDTWGTIWCWAANVASLVLIVRILLAQTQLASLNVIDP